MHRSWFALVLLAAPAAALAHAGHEHGDLAAGFLHPLSGFDHLLALAGIGFWAARQSAHGARVAAIGVAFLVAILAGFTAGLLQAPLPGVELGIIASLLVTGVLVLGARRVPFIAAGAMAGGFALFHGFAHGAELAGGLSAPAFVGGFGAATVGLLSAGALAAHLAARGSAARPLERGVGGVLLAAGAYLLVGA